MASELGVASGDLPLAGLEFTVKDALAVAGVRCTAGSRLLGDHVGHETAPIVATLQRAGARVVGKTNCAEFALAPVPWNDLFGTTLNPRDGSLTVGGSSCGCAAAVAGGLVPFSVGSDYGGSVRYPAECAGIVGFRPALGTVDAAGQVPTPPPGSPRARFSVPGLLCRDLELLERLLRVLMPDQLADPGGEAGELDGEVIDEAEEVFAAIRAGDDLADLRALARGREELLTAPMRALLAAPSQPVATDAEARLAALRERVAQALRRTPVLLAPVSTRPTPALDECSGSPEHVAAVFRSLRPSRAVTLLGLHSIAVPVEAGRNLQAVAAPGALGAALRVTRGLSG